MSVALTAEQRDVVACDDELVSVVACPGAGKTTTMVHKAASWLGEGVPASSIAMITFTRLAARVMQERLRALVGPACDEVYVGTFHSLCFATVCRHWQSLGYGSPHLMVLDNEDRSAMLRLALEAVKDKRITVALEQLNHYGSGLCTESPVIRAYESIIRAENACDYSLLAVTMLKLMDNAEARRETAHRCCFLIVDEYQDADPAQHAFYSTVARRLMCVGDPFQCQPAGTMVRTTLGPCAIENLDPERHRIVPFDRRGGRLVRDGSRFGITSRHYEGELLRLRVGDRETACTPEHLWSVRFDRTKRHLYAVYLMRSGNRFRVGRCQLFRDYAGQTAFGPGERARQEGADALWILRLCSDIGEAEAWQQIVSCRYAVPTTCFIPRTLPAVRPEIKRNWKTARSAETIDLIYSELTPRPLDCLRDFGRRLEYPLWSSTDSRNKRGCRVPLLVHACNLMPEAMEVPTAGHRCRDIESLPFSLHRDAFSGLVYSLDVPRWRHYVADGICTHNCIYGWRGASPKLIGGGTVKYLSQNHRSAGTIVRAAAVFSSTIDSPSRATMKEVRDFDGKMGVVADDQAESMLRGLLATPGMTIAILARTNYILEQWSTRLNNAGIKHQIGSHTDRLIRQDDIKRVLAYMAWRDLPDAGVLCDRVLVTEGWTPMERAEVRAVARGENLTLFDAAHQMEPAEWFADDWEDLGLPELIAVASVRVRLKRGGVDAEAFGALKTELARYLQQTPRRYANAAGFYNWLVSRDPQDSIDPGASVVQLMTIHACKGLEFDSVLVVGLGDEELPWRGAKADDPQEERRLFYVAMTRAKDALVFVLPEPHRRRSPFIAEAVS